MLAGGNAKILKKAAAKQRERAALTIQCAERQASARAEVREAREACSRREAKARQAESRSGVGGEARRKPASAAAASVTYPPKPKPKQQRSVKKANATRWSSGERDYTHLETEEGSAEGMTMAEFLAIIEEEDDQKSQEDEAESRLRAEAWAREGEVARAEEAAARVAAGEARAKRVREREEVKARIKRVEERANSERQSKEAVARAAREQEEQARRQRVAGYREEEEEKARQQRAMERAGKADAKRAAEREREEAKRSDEKSEASRKFLKERVNLKERKKIEAASRSREQADAAKPFSHIYGSGIVGSKARTKIQRSKKQTSGTSEDETNSSTTPEGSPVQDLRKRIVAAKRRASARFAKENARAKVSV